MKQVPMKSEKIMIEGKESDFNYAETLISIIKKPGPNGFDLEEMRQGLKIINILESCSKGVVDSVQFEDADWEYLSRKVNAFRWGMAHPVILELCDAVTNAKTVAS